MQEGLALLCKFAVYLLFVKAPIELIVGSISRLLIKHFANHRVCGFLWQWPGECFVLPEPFKELIYGCFSVTSALSNGSAAEAAFIVQPQNTFVVHLGPPYNRFPFFRRGKSIIS